MASKKLSRQQLEQLIMMTGGDLHTLSALEIPQNQILAVLVSNPQLLQMSRSRAKETSESLGIDRFREDFEYDPESNVNDVLMGYETMPEGYRDFAKTYFSLIKETGGVKKGIDEVNNLFRSRRKELMQEYGLDEDEINDFQNTLNTDAEKFIESENTRRKNQYKGFLSKRAKYGATGEQSGEEALLSSATGISGLSTLPTSEEDFVKQEAKRFAEFVKGKGKSDKAVAALMPEFEKGLKGKVGKNFQSIALSRLLKKNLMGE